MVAYKRSLAGGIGVRPPPLPPLAFILTHALMPFAQRAEQNIRNVGAKILAAKVANETAEAQDGDVAKTIGQALESEIKAQEEKGDGEAREKQ